MVQTWVVGTYLFLVTLMKSIVIHPGRNTLVLEYEYLFKIGQTDYQSPLTGKYIIALFIPENERKTSFNSSRIFTVDELVHQAVYFDD